MITICSVNTATVSSRLIQGKAVPTAIAKRPMAGAVAVLPLGLAGDEQADQSVHGGLSKAVYAYPQEHYAFWQGVRTQARVTAADEALPPGFMGENLTLTGLLEAQLWIGDRLELPGCVLAWLKPITSLNL